MTSMGDLLGPEPVLLPGDPAAEAELYRTLKERLPNTTLVSIAHRPSVAAFHDRRLMLRREEGRPGDLVPGELAPAAGGNG